MDIYSNNQRCFAINNWKRRGLIYDDYHDLFEVYRKTLNCQHCNKEFRNKRDRHLDHNHATGLFRKIVCNRCNSQDFYINHPDGMPINRNEKVKCECGLICSRINISRHKRSAKHIDWWLNNVD
jgi:Zn finger protein HypA/HybF involved in hydrogenase expression